jgi:hypothetical protein
MADAPAAARRVPPLGDTYYVVVDRSNDEPQTVIATSNTPEMWEQFSFDRTEGKWHSRLAFTTVEPLAGWRHVEVTERRTAVDFAHQMQWLVDQAYPDAKVIRVVLDT